MDFVCDSIATFEAVLVSSRFLRGLIRTFLFHLVRRSRFFRYLDRSVCGIGHIIELLGDFRYGIALSVSVGVFSAVLIVFCSYICCRRGIYVSESIVLCCSG